MSRGEGCLVDAGPSTGPAPPATAAPAVATPATLRVLREAKVSHLLGEAGRGLHRLEASGVLAEAGLLWVIFDNLPFVVRLPAHLAPDHPDTLLLRQPVGPIGYEDLALDRVGGRYFLLIEAARSPAGVLKAKVCEFDRQFRLVGCHWLDAPLERANKGIEGLGAVRRAGTLHLLGLCEGNDGRGGRAGRRPGNGRVHVFAEPAGDGDWTRVDTIALPPSVRFTDYSGLTIDGDRMAVVSQESSALWVGRLHPSRWAVVGEGTTYLFPRDRHGRVLYGTIEGVSWLDERTLAVVSDRAKRRQPGRMRAKDESVHVVQLP